MGRIVNIQTRKSKKKARSRVSTYSGPVIMKKLLSPCCKRRKERKEEWRGEDSPHVAFEEAAALGASENAQLVHHVVGREPGRRRGGALILRGSAAEELPQVGECLIWAQEALAVVGVLKVQSKVAEGRPAEQATLAVEVKARAGVDVEIPEVRGCLYESQDLKQTSAGAARLEVLDDGREGLSDVVAPRTVVLTVRVGSHVLMILL